MHLTHHRPNHNLPMLSTTPSPPAPAPYPAHPTHQLDKCHVEHAGPIGSGHSTPPITAAYAAPLLEQ